MTEFSGAKGVIINGREQNGRTYQRDDGTYESLDLLDVTPGQTLTVVTSEGVQELVKVDGEKYDSALSNWKMGADAVRLSLSEPTGKGTDFIHHGIVLKERLGLQVSYPASEKPHVVHGLGVIASIAGLRQVEATRPQEVAV
jgi:hypothetical protein